MTKNLNLFAANSTAPYAGHHGSQAAAPDGPSLRGALRCYKRAVGWSILMITSVILTGYAHTLIVAVLSLPRFTHKFGERIRPDDSDNAGEYQIGVWWLLGIQSPRRLTMLGCLLFIACSLINFCAASLPTIAVGTALQSIPLGSFAMLAIAYAAEVCPCGINHRFSGLATTSWAVGQALATGVLWGFVDNDVLRDGDASIWVPMALQWLIPVVVAIGCYRAPESPWWLARQGRFDNARLALRRLRSSSEDANTSCVEDRLDEIRELIKMEEEMRVGASFPRCFKGPSRRRTEIALMCSAGQQLVGFAIASQVVYFLHLAGLENITSFKLAFVNSIVFLLGTLFFFLISAFIGFRAIYIWGLSICCSVLLLVGLLEILERAGPLALSDCVPLGQAALLFVWSFIYGATIAPVTHAISCDISATALRAKTLALSQTVHEILSLTQAVAGPFMLHSQFGNLQGYAAFPAASVTIVWLVWAVLRLPEMDKLPPQIMDQLFEGRVPAREFSRQAVRLRLGLGLGIGPLAIPESPRTEVMVQQIIEDAVLSTD